MNLLDDFTSLLFLLLRLIIILTYLLTYVVSLLRIEHYQESVSSPVTVTTDNFSVPNKAHNNNLTTQLITRSFLYLCIGIEGRNVQSHLVLQKLLTLYWAHHTKTAEQRTTIQQYCNWYTGRWWVGCYIWYSEEGTGRAVPTSYYYSLWHYNYFFQSKGLIREETVVYEYNCVPCADC